MNELQEFCEWCGFKVEEIIGASGNVVGWEWTDPNGKECLKPKLDINFLFKFAVPKLGDYVCVKFDIEYGKVWAYVSNEKVNAYGSAEIQNGDLEEACVQALYQAIQKVRRSK